MDDINIGDLIERELEKAFRERGHINILIAGRTGVGKSTLINSALEGNLAKVGQGERVTEHTREIKREGIPISIFDTRGLEMAEFRNTLEELEKFISERNRDPDEKKHIHVAWVCIAEDSRRVEDAEIELTAMLDRYVPVLGVITKARSDQGFRGGVQRLLPKVRNVMRVRAIREQDDDGHTRDPMGLEELADLTNELVPEGQRRAFAAAQKASCKLKKAQAQKFVAAAASVAAGIGAVPIPFADAILLVPSQVGMLAKISSVYNLSLSEGALRTMVASIAGGAAATMSGRLIVGGLLKMIPGAGALAGGAISASTASLMTIVLGGTYISILDALCIKYAGESPSEEEVIDEVKKRFKRKQDDNEPTSAKEEKEIDEIEKRFKKEREDNEDPEVNPDRSDDGQD